MESWLIWILLGLFGLGAELLLPGVFLVWIGLAAIGTGCVVWLLGLHFAGSVGAFMVLLGAAVTLALRLRPRMQGAAWRVNAPEAGLAGRRATVLGSEGGMLRVRLGDSDWAARLPPGVTGAEPGMLVQVEAVDGTILVVRPQAEPAARRHAGPEAEVPTGAEAAAADAVPVADLRPASPAAVPEAVRRARARLARVEREPLLAGVAGAMGGVLDDLAAHPEWLPLAAHFLNVHLDGLDRIVDRLAAGAALPEGLPRLLEDLKVAAQDLRARLRAEESAALEIQVKVLAARLREEGFA